MKAFDVFDHRMIYGVIEKVEKNYLQVTYPGGRGVAAPPIATIERIIKVAGRGYLVSLKRIPTDGLEEGKPVVLTYENGRVYFGEIKVENIHSPVAVEYDDEGEHIRARV